MKKKTDFCSWLIFTSRFRREGHLNFFQVYEWKGRENPNAHKILAELTQVTRFVPEIKTEGDRAETRGTFSTSWVLSTHKVSEDSYEPFLRNGHDKIFTVFHLLIIPLSTGKKAQVRKLTSGRCICHRTSPQSQKRGLKVVYGDFARLFSGVVGKILVQFFMVLSVYERILLKNWYQSPP